MQRLFSLLILVLFTCIFASCEKDYFSTTVEVDLSEHSDNLVVLAPFSPDLGDKGWYQRFYLVLVKSNDILDESGSYERIENATVDLFEEGAYQFTFEHWNNGLYITSTATGIEAGKEYELEIHTEEYGKVMAKSYVPNRVNVLKAYISDSSYYDLEQDLEMIEISLEIEDEPNVENFYFLNAYSVLRTDTLDQFYGQITTSKDPVFDSKNGDQNWLEIEDLFNTFNDRTLTFKDVLFANQVKTLKIYLDKRAFKISLIHPITNEFLEVDAKFALSVGAMSRDLYLYKHSAIEQYVISSNPFAEAVRVYSNIEGGIGIFGGFVEDTVWVEQ